MAEIDFAKKRCMRCGTSCDLQVLVCPNCSEVLPDGKLPTTDYSLHKFLPSTGNASTDIAICRIVLFLFAFAIVIWIIISSWQKQLP